jgi:hypothetical protein
MGCFLGDAKGAPISSGRMTLLWSPCQSALDRDPRSASKMDRIAASVCCTSKRHRKSGASCRTSRTRSPRGRASEYGNLLISPIFFKNAVVFFNIVVRGREPIPEPDGGELAGDKEARKHAEMIAQEMLSNRSRYKRGLEHWAFVVTDEAGRQVAVVPFSDRSRIRTSSKSK